KTEGLLHERGIRTVRDLRGVEPLQLVDWFGRWGGDLHAKARGISDSPVSNEWEPKSVGEQETFEVDTLDAAFVLERVRGLARDGGAAQAGRRVRPLGRGSTGQGTRPLGEPGPEGVGAEVRGGTGDVRGGSARRRVRPRARGGAGAGRLPPSRSPGVPRLPDGH